jgi:hypothetical protein
MIIFMNFLTLQNSLPVGGICLGLGYVSPVSTLIRWFPDRRGFATGMAIMGFGGGAIVAAPLKEALLKYFAVAPTYLGPASAVDVITESGKRFVKIGAEMQEVIVATPSDIKVSAFSSLSEGVYLVGTENTGAAATFFTLGLSHFLLISLGAMPSRVSAAGWLPASITSSASPIQLNPVCSKSMLSQQDVHIDVAHKTPQFWSLSTCLCMNVSAGGG